MASKDCFKAHVSPLVVNGGDCLVGIGHRGGVVLGRGGILAVESVHESNFGFLRDERRRYIRNYGGSELCLDSGAGVQDVVQEGVGMRLLRSRGGGHSAGLRRILDDVVVVIAVIVDMSFARLFYRVFCFCLEARELLQLELCVGLVRVRASDICGG